MPFTCPVCTRSDLPANALSCPGCDVDLAPLLRVRAARRLLEGPSARPPRGIFGSRLWVGGLAMVGIAIAATVVWEVLDPSGREARAPAIADVARQEAFPVASAPPSASVAADASSTGLDYVATRLSSVAGIALERRSSELLVSFPGGLFASGSDRPSPDAAARLARVARALSESASPLRVTVEGRTDDVAPRPGGRWPDNWSLGLARAHGAAALMRRGLDGTGVRWLATSNEAAAAGAASPEARREQRTVVLHIEADSEASPPRSAAVPDQDRATLGPPPQPATRAAARRRGAE